MVDLSDPNLSHRSCRLTEDFLAVTHESHQSRSRKNEEEDGDGGICRLPHQRSCRVVREGVVDHETSIMAKERARERTEAKAE